MARNDVRPAVQRLGARLLLTAALCAGLGAAVPCSHAAPPPPSFQYLYVEANSGDSSGGHVAICFADRCYHFQQDQGQTIRLHRDDADEFDYRYRLLGNRTIHATSVDVSPADYERLRAAFQTRFLVQDRQYDVLQSLTEDRQLLQQMAGGGPDADQRSADVVIRVPGSGYFVADEPDSAGGATQGFSGSEHSATLERLSERVRMMYGSQFIERRTLEVRQAIAQLDPAPAADILPETGRLPLVPAGFATRHRELLSAWLALRVLGAAPPLRAGSFRVTADAEFALQPAEITVLREYAQQVADALVRLLVSERPDWGTAMLAGMARLAALEASIDSGYLVFLDEFPEDVRVEAPDTISRHAATLAQVRAERQADFVGARAVFFASGARQERDFSAMEAAASLLLDMDAALRQHAPLHLYTGVVVPTKSAIRSDWPLPELSEARRRRSLAAAQESEDRYRRALAGLYHYDLISHNCVTEIFRTMEAALVTDQPEAARGPAAVRAASTRALGGYVEWRRDFIPFVSADAVGRAYRVSSRVERPSYRRLALAQMYRHENPVHIDLRESNVLTARSYEPNGDDPIFLFFTDDVVIRRPLYGVANLAVGIGGTLAGIAMLPLDGGAMLRAGLDGAVFSVPELVFVNIRKGSLAFAPRRWLSDDDARPLAAVP